jgi:hypothetical protein
VVAGAAANGLAYLPVKQGNAFELHRLQHYTSPAKKPSVSLVVDVCGTSLADATTYMEDAFESAAFAAAPAPAPYRNELPHDPPHTKRFGFANQKNPQQAQHQAELAAKMAPIRDLHEAEKVAGDAVEHKLLMELLEQPAAEKAKEAEAWTCKYTGCNVKYTDATSSGAKSKKNYGFCSFAAVSAGS